MSHAFAHPSRHRAAFTLVELLVAVSLLCLLMLLFAQMSDSALRVWRDGQARSDSYQRGRSAVEMLGRELAPAVVDTRMQLAIAPAEIFPASWRTGAATGAPILLWMAPLGEKGELRCLGYFLSRDETGKTSRLRRIYIEPGDSTTSSPYFPKMVDINNPRNADLRTSPTDAAWFTRHWNPPAFDDSSPENLSAFVSTVADGVIAFWAQGYDPLGNPIPWLDHAKNHPPSKLYYNSAAYFQVATSLPFDGGATFQYLASTRQSMKANRVPAAIEITIVTADQNELERLPGEVPPQVNQLDGHDALDLTASLEEYQRQLREAHLYRTRTFSARVILNNGN